MKDHLKSLAAPKTWGFKRKKNIFTAKPNPGAHKLEDSVCLNFVIKNMLSLAKTKKEAKYILFNKNILVNGTRRTDVRFQVGLMDVITITETQNNYLLLVNKNGKLFLKEIQKKDSEQKLSWIKGKKTQAGKIQLNLSDGRNILTDSKEFKVGDSLILKIPSQEIIKHLPFTENATAFIIKGKNIGVVGSVKSISGNIIKIENDGIITETTKKNLVIVGDKAPAIPL